MLQVVINFALVKGLFYKIDAPDFHQWTDQSQFYALKVCKRTGCSSFWKWCVYLAGKP